MKWIILLLIMTFSYAEIIGQCDSLQIIAEADRIHKIEDLEERSHSYSIFIEELIDQQCYKAAFGQQVNKIEFSRSNFPFHIEHSDLILFDSLVLRYSAKMNINVRDSFLTENIIAWADFNERTGHHSNTIEKFYFFKSKYFSDPKVLPDKLINSLERSFRYTGNEYLAIKEYGIAMEYYNDAKNISNQMTSKQGRLSRGAINLGYIAGTYLMTGTIPESKSIFYDHLNMTKELFGLDEVYLGHLLTAYRNLSDLHLANNNLDSAAYYVGQSSFLEKRYNRSQNKSLKIKTRILSKQQNFTEARKILSILFEKRHQNNDPSRYVHFRDNLEIANLLIDAKMFKEAKILLEFIENINNERMENEVSHHPRYYSNKNIYLDILLGNLHMNDSMGKDLIAVKIMHAYQIINESIEKAISKEAKLNFASQSARFTDFSLRSLSSTSLVNNYDIFYAIESSKAATSFKSWLQNQLINFDTDESLMYVEQEVENQLNKIRVELTEPNDPLRIQELDKFLALNSSRLDSIKSLLEEKHPAYYKMKYNWSIPSLSEVQESLDNDEVLINYYEGEEILYAMVIANDYTHTIEIDSVSILKDSIAEYSKKIQEEKHWTRSFSTISNYVYQKIVSPLDSYLKDRIIISPSGSLFQVPFAALNCSSEKDSFNYLIYNHAISYVPSCSFFYQMRNMNEENIVEIAALVAPKFSNPSSPSKPQFALRSSLYSLKYNVPEVQAISKYVDSELLVNEYATKESALDIMSNADIIHLATHAKSNMDSPDKSFVAFYKSNESMNEDDYKWYLDDISKRPLLAKMIVLSACETSLGRVYKGEGAMSLANSCFYAGVHSVVASLWSAADNTSYEIMKNFYANLDQGIPKDKALQKTQIDYLENNSGTAVNPYYWAGFSVMGNTGALQFKKTPNYRNWLLVTFGVIALFLFYPQIKLAINK